jgi:hypothetical protein
MSIPAGFLAFVAQNIQDPFGNKLASGTLEAVVTDGNDVPRPGIAGGGGGAIAAMNTAAPSSIPITAGAIPAGTTIIDTSLTKPMNLCVRITIRDASGNVLYKLTGVQPSSAGGATTFNLDTYAPNAASYAVIQSGPPGQGFTFRGEWAANTSYAAYDVVTYQGGTYLVTTAHTSGSAIDGTKFAQLATSGATTPNFVAPVTAPSVVLGTTLDPNGQTQVSSASSDPGPSVVADSKGFVANYTDDEGVFHATAIDVASFDVQDLSAASLASVTMTVGSYADISSSPSDIGPQALVDAKGFVPMFVDDEGVLQLGAARVGSLVVETSLTSPGPVAPLQGVGNGAFDYEMMYVPTYGQSLSIGTWSILNNPTGPYVFTTTQKYDSLMFVGGTLPLANSAATSNYASLVPLIEQLYGSNNGNWQPAANAAAAYNSTVPLGETPLSGAYETIKAMIAAENGLQPADQPYQFIGSCPGVGGQSIAQLSSGTQGYTRLLDEVTRAKAFADAQGKIFGVPAIFWIQGENNVGMTTAQYVSAATTLLNQINSDIKAITGQTKDIQFLMYQTFGYAYGNGVFAISVAQWELGQQQANFHCVCPAYELQTDFADQTHLSPQGNKMLGGYMGKAYKRIVVDGIANYSPLSQVSVQVSGSTILLTTNLDKTPLVIDTSNYTTENGAQPNAGFTLVDGSGNPVTISSVTIVGQNRIRIVAAQPVVAGYTLQYGAYARGGNIRDNDGAFFTVDCGGVSYPLHNWLRQFAHTF